MTAPVSSAHSQLLQPINAQQRLQVMDATEAWIGRAAQLVVLPLPPVTVLFDLRGASAGMFRARGGECCIRYNPWIFAKCFEDSLRFTVPHEVAHYAVYSQRHRRRVRPHGAEWQHMMRAFGVPPDVTFVTDLEGVPVRRQQRHAYRCACRGHAVSTVRHKRMSEGRAHYLCRCCKSPLLPAH